MSEHRGSTDNPVEWRKLNERLWAGSTPDGPVGTIEHGRRYYAIDTLGSVIARSRDLPGAQAALAENAVERASADRVRPAASHGRRAARRFAA